MNKYMSIILSGLGIVLFALLWFLVADYFSLVDESQVPKLQTVFKELIEYILFGNFCGDLKSSVGRWFLGFSLGVVLGTLFGFLLGLFPMLGAILRGPIEFFRAIPVTALIPFIFLLMSASDNSKSLMVFISSFLLLVSYTEEGVKNVSSVRKEIFVILNASKFKTLCRLIIPETLCRSIYGLRLAFSYSVLVEIVSEMFMGSNSGLGQRIYESYMYNNVSELYSGIIVIGTLGYLGSFIFQILENFATGRGYATTS